MIPLRMVFCFGRISRHYSTVNQLETLIPISVPTEELCAHILDEHPSTKTLKQLHAMIIKDQNLQTKPSLVIKLMRAYASTGELGVTRQLFEESPEKNSSVVFLNVMIRSYVNNGQYHDALLLFKRMPVAPDHYTYPCMLKASSGCENLWVGMQIHCAVVKVGLFSNQFAGNGLVAMYGKCGCLVEARRVLNEMPSLDVVSWNSMVAGCAKSGEFGDALSVCKEMMSSGLRPDGGTMASLMPAVSNTTVENVEFVKEMFLQLSKKSLISWNVMLAVYVNNLMATEAVDLYVAMKSSAFEPDVITIATVLPACGDLSALSLGRQIHNYIERRRFCPNLSVENALVDMYAKCGCLSEAREVFDSMRTRDIVTWTTMVSAYGVNGQGELAIHLFSEMMGQGIVPDSIAFVSIMAACSHSGFLKEGRRYYNMMTEEYRIAPKIEHYSCMVDLLGRAGRVNEAYTFIQEMLLEPDERIWGALLGACRVHSNMTIGLAAADRLFKIVPDQASYYVLLSNIYAKAGRWEEVRLVRLMMQEKGIRKTAGMSNVELSGVVHTFMAGDRAHPQWREIYKELDVLVGKMVEAGYVPETESALHDVEEEEKQQHLAVHSEKLAVVFAIMNSCGSMPIRITKNLRVCGDCHVAIKLMSKIAEREIVVRDTYRFHHFKDGVCSCGDYW